MITVASSFPSARLTHKISTCHEQRVYEMWRVSASRRKEFPAPSLNMMNENLKHRITATEPRYISNYQRGAQSGLPSRETSLSGSSDAELADKKKVPVCREGANWIDGVSRS
jgi:hypothetical protein